VPSAVLAEDMRAQDLYRQHSRCAYCQLLDNERAAGQRVVLDTSGFIAFCPFASWQPYETWVMPTQHERSFELAASYEALQRLAGVLHPLIARLESLVPAAAYNMLVRTAPWGVDDDRWNHWRIELLPRSNSFAGLEVGTALHINPLSPELAAEQLRTILSSQSLQQKL
jgi:UDPglucose--hexose-1-phosphate uridylyltransferase